METPYERGYQSGRVIDPSCCSLEEHEQIYQEEIDGLPDIKKKDPVQAAEHAEYMKGWIAGVHKVFQE